MVTAIALDGVRKAYPDGTMVVDGIDLEVADGEFVVLLGPTGCGKTTILRIVAGLETATAGQVWLGGRPADGIPAHSRRVAMVFQDYALYPHLTAEQNIAFPLRTEHVEEAEITARVAEVARLVGVTDILRRKPHRLSGGQRQRVAMARAIIRRPLAFLLDEPLSNVDAAVRAELRAEIVALAHGLGIGALYVTHDQTEAMTMADRIVVLRRGRIEQVGTPGQVYSDPARLFVAAFLGVPRTSLLQAAVYVRPGQEAVLDLGEQALSLPWSDRRASALAGYHTDRVTVAIRTDGVRLVSDTQPDALHGRVVHIEHLGNESIVSIDIGGVPTATSLSQLEIPDTLGELADTLVREPAQTPDGLRGALARLVPHTHHGPAPAGTARTQYGFYPVYRPESGGPPTLMGTLSLRVPLPEPPPAIGATVAVHVDFDQIFLFDRDGDRIRLT